MKWWLPASAALALALPAAGLAWADLAFPRIPGSERPYRFRPYNITPLVIEASDTIPQPILIIPRGHLHRVTKIADAGGPPPHLAEGHEPPRRGPELALAPIVLLGLLVRGRGGRPFLMLALAGVLLFGPAMLLQASRPPGKSVTARASPSYPLGEARIELTDEGNTVRLVLPRRTLSRLARKAPLFPGRSR